MDLGCGLRLSVVRAHTACGSCRGADFIADSGTASGLGVTDGLLLRSCGETLRIILSANMLVSRFDCVLQMILQFCAMLLGHWVCYTPNSSARTSTEWKN